MCDDGVMMLGTGRVSEASGVHQAAPVQHSSVASLTAATGEISGAFEHNLTKFSLVRHADNGSLARDWMDA